MKIEDLPAEEARDAKVAWVRGKHGTAWGYVCLHPKRVGNIRMGKVIGCGECEDCARLSQLMAPGNEGANMENETKNEEATRLKARSESEGWDVADLGHDPNWRRVFSVAEVSLSDVRSVAGAVIGRQGGDPWVAYGQLKDGGWFYLTAEDSSGWKTWSQRYSTQEAVEQIALTLEDRRRFGMLPLEVEVGVTILTGEEVNEAQLGFDGAHVRVTDEEAKHKFAVVQRRGDDPGAKVEDVDPSKTIGFLSADLSQLPKCEPAEGVADGDLPRVDMDKGPVSDVEAARLLPDDVLREEVVRRAGRKAGVEKVREFLARPDDGSIGFNGGDIANLLIASMDIPTMNLDEKDKDDIELWLRRVLQPREGVAPSLARADHNHVGSALRAQSQGGG